MTVLPGSARVAAVVVAAGRGERLGAPQKVLLPLAGPMIWFVKVQRALNQYWESKGAPPP